VSIAGLAARGLAGCGSGPVGKQRVHDAQPSGVSIDLGGRAGQHAVAGEQVVDLRPLRDVRHARWWRRFPGAGRAAPGCRPITRGYYWSATTSGHVIYESRLETVTGTTLLRTDPGMPITLTPEGEQFG
jgi:hypothetical protein